MNGKCYFTCASEGAGDKRSDAPHSAHSGGTAGDLDRQYCSSVLHLFNSLKKKKTYIHPLKSKQNRQNEN